MGSFRLRSLAVALALALVAAGCGDDGGGSGGGEPTAADATTTSLEPSVGGEATFLLPNEIGSMDPLRSTGSTLDASRMFAVYGALITAKPANADVEMVLAESLESTSPDFTQWTLKLRPGLMFTDGAPFDAEAVRANWTRISDPANRSPGFTLVASMASFTAVDPVTVQITLKAPNSTFPQTLSRSALNYIASAKAIAEGHDLSSAPIGAGPFIQKEWLRDSHTTLERNPGWYDAPRPYVDMLTFRIVGEAGQAVDTVVTGGATIAYVQSPTVVEDALDGNNDLAWFGNIQHSGRTVSLNNSAPPFNDPRARRVMAVGVDRQAVVDIANPGGKTAESFTAPESLWTSGDAALPEFDPAEAQRLIDEIVADTGQPLRFAIVTSNSMPIQQAARAVQTALSQYESVEVEVLDSPTFTQRGLTRQYQAIVWGFPWVDPEPGLYNAIRSGLATNYSAYSNPMVDAALDKARTLGDIDARIEAYKPVFHAQNLYLHHESLQIDDSSLYDEGNVRTDLMWFAP